MTAAFWIGPLARLAFGGGLLIMSAAAMAQTLPDSEAGRFTMSVVPDGVLRLDTRTGAVSICNNKQSDWACYVVPDERTALDAEIGRLQNDNDALRDRLAQIGPTSDDKIEDALPKSDPLVPSTPKADERKIEIPLPSDKDVDQAMGFLENAWRRLVDMVARMQRDASGKI